MRKYSADWINNNKKEELMNYKDILDYIERNHEEQGGIYLKFWWIIGHQKVKKGDKDYKGSSWNLMIEWEDGKYSIEFFAWFFTDTPYKVAGYALKSDILHTDG